MNDIFKGQAAKILACYSNTDDCIEKGGEGSKGGQVIGHTSSGKPIYQTKNQAEHEVLHKDYNDQDHKDAYLHHAKLAKEHDKKLDNSIRPEVGKGLKEGVKKKDYMSTMKERNNHDNMMYRHSNSLQRRGSDIAVMRPDEHDKAVDNYKIKH